MNSSRTFYAPISKKDPSQHMVFGYASTEALDSQGEIVKADALKSALADYMKFANIREMHQPKAVGKTKQASLDSKGLYIGVKVVDKDAWEKVEEGVYNGFSIGGRVNTMVGNEITNLALSEISLVDRPANPDAVFDLWKSADMKKKTFSTDQRKALASKGKAMSDGSFPITDSEDVSNAVHDWGRAGSKASVKAHIVRRAKALGATDQLPDDWQKVAKGTRDAMTLTGHIQNLESMRDNESNEGDEATVHHLNNAITHLRNAASSEVLEDDNDAERTAGNDGIYMSENAEDLLKVVDQKIQEGKMPDEKEINGMLKAQGIEVNEKTISVLKYELAGLIVKAVEKNMQKVQNLDYLKKQANMVLDEADVKSPDTVKEKNSFKKIMGMINKAEGLMKTQNDTGNLYELDDENTTGEEVTTTNANRASASNRGKPKGNWEDQNDEDKDETEYTLENSDENLPEAEESHMDGDDDGNPAVSLALGAIRQMVEMLNAKGLSGALTSDEIGTLEDGVKAGSELTSRNQTSIPQPGNAITAAVQAQMKKIESPLLAKINKLEALVEKLAKTPMPMKVKANFSTVEKVEKTGEEKATMDLSKAEARANELHELMKANPNNLALQEEARVLSPQIMKLRREAHV